MKKEFKYPEIEKRLIITEPITGDTGGGIEGELGNSRVPGGEGGWE